jgi:zinc protease
VSSAASTAPASGPALHIRRIGGAPLVAVRVLLPGGGRREEIPGLALVTGRTLAEGTVRRDWRALADAAESRGMSLSSSSNLEAHGVGVDALAEDWEEALALAAEVVFEPAFPVDRLRWVARQAAAELEAQADQADVLTARAFAHQLYFPHPKGRPAQGDPESLARIEPASCRAFHAAALARGGLVVVAGPIDADAVREVAARRFAALGPPAVDGFEPPAPSDDVPRRVEIRTRALDQAHLFVGQRTIDRRHPDYTALELAAVALGAGAGLSGRVPARVRDREGLAYHASADLVAGASLDTGRLVVYVGTSPANLERAERAAREEIARLVADGLEPAELEEARSYLIGREPFRRETARQWADLASHATILGLPLEDLEWRLAALREVSHAEVSSALRRHVDPERLYVTVGLPAA